MGVLNDIDFIFKENVNNLFHFFLRSKIILKDVEICRTKRIFAQ